MHVDVKTDFTVGDLINLKQKKILTVNHEYQRGLRWTDLQQRMFLDSIFRDYSIPAFYFHEKIESAADIENKFFEIVDGQQRVDAIYTYSENAFPLIDPSDSSGSRFPNFVKDRPCPWAGLRYEELPDDLKEKLRTTKIVAYKLTTDDENEIRDLFIRLQGGTPLTPQDKRDSWPGNFTEFVLKVGGKSQVAKWFGLPLFRELFKGSESRRRQLVAQAFMLFDSVRRNKTFCDIKSANIDEFYHQNVDFGLGSGEAKRFETICRTLHDALAGKRKKIVGHHLIHLILLCDWLMEEYAKGWEQQLAGCLHQFERRCIEASKATKSNQESEFIHYWPSYAQWTQTQADLGRTIQRRHAFFAAELRVLLNPKRLDDRRGFSEFERQVIFFRDGQQCQRCRMVEDDHPVHWDDCEVHHVVPFSEGGLTELENGALVHRDCHPKSELEVGQFRDWWAERTGQHSGRQGLPPDGTKVRFNFKGDTYVGAIEGGAVRLRDAHNGNYRTFSAASYAITRTSRNGWRDWEVMLPSQDSWITAAQWRDAP